MEILLCISIALAAGLAMSRLMKVLGLPAVTGYLISGILVGPFCLGALGVNGLGFISLGAVEELGIISDVALGFIAFAIGNEFRLSELKHIGKQALVIGIFQAVFTTLVVDAVLIGVHFLIGDKLPISTAIILGAIASATAPAATLMVVRQYKAKGKLTDLLLPIVALDDAVGLVIFSVSFGIARALTTSQIDVVSIAVEPLAEIVVSLLLGLVMGFLFSFAERFFHSNSKRLSLAVTAVILTVALSQLQFEVGGVHIHFSTLLVCMMLATVFCNVCDFSPEIMDRTDKWTYPLFILFFVISGAELDLSILSDIVVIGIGVIYIISRSAGKYFGASISAKMTNCDGNIVKNLGITLLPQAGVALGMAMTVAKSDVGGGSVIRNIVLFGVLIYERVGPMLTKMALTRAGDISPKEAGKTARKLPAQK